MTSTTTISITIHVNLHVVRYTYIQFDRSTYYDYTLLLSTLRLNNLIWNMNLKYLDNRITRLL